MVAAAPRLQLVVVRSVVGERPLGGAAVDPAGRKLHGCLRMDGVRAGGRGAWVTGGSAARSVHPTRCAAPVTPSARMQKRREIAATIGQHPPCPRGGQRMKDPERSR